MFNLYMYAWIQEKENSVHFSKIKVIITFLFYSASFSVVFFARRHKLVSYYYLYRKHYKKLFLYYNMKNADKI